MFSENLSQFGDFFRIQIKTRPYTSKTACGKTAAVWISGSEENRRSALSTCLILVKESPPHPGKRLLPAVFLNGFIKVMVCSSV